MNNRTGLRILKNIEAAIGQLPGTILVTKAALKKIHYDRGATRRVSKPLYTLTRTRSLDPIIQYERGALIGRRAPIQRVWSRRRLTHYDDKDKGRELFFCAHCGSQYLRGATICRKCGRRVVVTQGADEQKKA
jgi:ribosomal protein L32